MVKPTRFRSNILRALVVLFIFSGFWNIPLLIVPGEAHAKNAYTDLALPFATLFGMGFALWYLLYNKWSILSTFKRASLRSFWDHYRTVFHVEQSTAALGAFTAWCAASILWAADPFLALTRLCALLAGISAFFVVSRRPSSMFHVEHRQASKVIMEDVPRGTSLLKRSLVFCSTWNIRDVAIASFLVMAAIDAGLSIYQFLAAKSLGVSLLGESIFRLGEPGIAKVLLFGEYFQRAYGLFPHPNINAFFLIASLTVLFWIVPRGTKGKSERARMDCSTWNITHGRYGSHLWALVVLVSLALILTFSKAVLLFFVIFLEYIALKNVPRGTMHRAECSTWNTISAKFIPFTVLITAVLVVIYMFIHSFSSFSEREVLIFEYAQTESNLLRGSGLGAYSSTWNNRGAESSSWMQEPVHNVYFLILSDLGVIGLILWIFYVLSLLNVPRGTRAHDDLLIWLFFAWIMAVDHYLWDSPQAIFIYFVFLGLWQGNSRYLTKN